MGGFRARVRGQNVIVASSVASPAPASRVRPRLLFFYSSVSGRCRRTEGFLAQVLQRRRNHDTFELVKVPVERRPDLAERFKIDVVPTVLVVEGRLVKARLRAPTGCRDLETFLHPWLR